MANVDAWSKRASSQNSNSDFWLSAGCPPPGLDDQVLLSLGAGLAVLASVLLLWSTGAVGIIESEDHPANILYLGVILAAFVGGVVSRFRADGLSLSMITAAVIQVVIGVVAVLRGWGEGSENWPQPVIVLSIIFGLIWLASAALFRRADRAHRAAGLGGSAAS